MSLGPEHAETHFNLAVVYERENKLNEALKQIIAALVIEPGDLDAAKHLWLDHLLRENGRPRVGAQHLGATGQGRARLRSRSNQSRSPQSDVRRRLRPVHSL